MSCGMSHPMSTGQMMVDQRPSYGRKRKKGRRTNQVMGKSGIIRPDKRSKAKYY